MNVEYDYRIIGLNVKFELNGFKDVITEVIYEYIAVNEDDVFKKEKYVTSLNTDNIEKFYEYPMITKKMVIKWIENVVSDKEIERRKVSLLEQFNPESEIRIPNFTNMLNDR